MGKGVAMLVRELLLALTLVSGLALVVVGVAMVAVPAAVILAGLGVAGLGVLFLTEVAG